MANLSFLQNKLRELESGEKSSLSTKLLWKPKEGTQTIRIVPSKFNKESPFTELSFYYNLGGKHYLAPSCLGKPDPIQEVVEALRAGGSNEEKEIAKKLQAQARTYVPIIVRGEEELGVRYWGFGVQVYKQLLKLMTNPKYGDITDLRQGRDIDVEFHKESKKKDVKTGKSFPETTIMAYPSVTPVVDLTRTDLLEKVKDQVDIKELFPLKSYDELKSAVDKWLNPEGTADDAATQAATPTPTPAAATPPSATSSPASAGAEDFEKFFNS
jgi:hypothetical protein